MDAISFTLPTHHEASTLAEFAAGLREVGYATIAYHLFEARLRVGAEDNDFSRWLEGELDERDLAAAIRSLDPYTHTMEGLRQRLLRMIATAARGGAVSMTAGLDAYAPFVVMRPSKSSASSASGCAAASPEHQLHGGGRRRRRDPEPPHPPSPRGRRRRAVDVIRGGDEFFAVTKTIHNALHGQAVTLTEHDNRRLPGDDRAEPRLAGAVG